MFNRQDDAIVVLPLDLHGTFPSEHHGRLDELGDAELDLSCLSPEFVLALGLRGYCVAPAADRDAVLDCISGWKQPVLDMR